VNSRKPSVICSDLSAIYPHPSVRYLPAVRGFTRPVEVINRGASCTGCPRGCGC